MTGEEEAFLREYVLHYSEIEDNQTFKSRYMQRFQDANAETHSNTSLRLDQVWKGHVEEEPLASTAYNTLRATASPN